ncbi:MAG: DUF2203 domain-containing protein [Aquificaceae bacterium]
MKVFDLDGAREVLTVIKPMVEAINTRREELYILLNQLEDEQDKLERLYLESQIRDVDVEIKKYLQKIESLGGVIKGTDPLLVDFLSVYKDRYIWLCWREDEDTILYWHELDEGFAGRKPIKSLKVHEDL